MTLLPSARPVGVFDSGLGGLSVLRELRRELPGEDFVYFADTAHCPIGARPDEEIRALTSAAVRWLARFGTKGTVVACNTASAFSLDALRAWAGDDHPIVGLVPALKPAVAATRTGAVGVLATPGTLRGTLLRDVIARFAEPAGVRVLTAVSERLVPFVEAGRWDGEETRAELRRVLSPLAEAGVDQLVLGCTHYPFLRGAIDAEFAGTFAFSDSGAAVARQTRRVLAERGALRPEATGPAREGQTGRVQVFTSGNPETVAPLVARLLGEAVPVGEAHPREEAV